MRLPSYSDVPGNVFDKFKSLFDPNSANPGVFVGNFVSRVLVFAIIAAGLFFFVKLISAGYTYLTSLGEPAKIQAASKELTNAAIGLLIVISAFFLAQIIQVVFGINILT